MRCHILHFSLFVCVQGDVSETVRMFFEESKSFPAATKSLLTIQEVDASLMRLAQLTKEDEQQSELENIAKKWDSTSSCQTNWAGHKLSTDEVIQLLKTGNKLQGNDSFFKGHMIGMKKVEKSKCWVELVRYWFWCFCDLLTVKNNNDRIMLNS